MVALSAHVLVAARILAPGVQVFAAQDASSLGGRAPRSRLLCLSDGRLDELAAWPFEAVDLEIARAQPLRVEVLGRDGEVGVFDDGVASLETLEPGTALGPMRRMVRVFGRVLCCGMQRHVFVRDASGRWIRFDAGLAATGDEAVDLDARIAGMARSDGGINAVVEAGTHALLAVGMRGEIWRFEDRSWRAVASPTRAMLTDATVLENGDAVACGLRGTLLQCRDGAWSAIADDAPSKLAFRSIAAFAGRVFVADGQALRAVDHGSLRLVDVGAESTVPCSRVVAGEGEILALAGQEVWVSHTGTDWRCAIG